MFSEEDTTELIKNLLDDTINSVKDKKIVRKIENIINFLREKEIREEIERRWEELKKKEPQSFISDVHEYTENINSINIEFIKETQSGIDVSFTGKAGGLTEFGTELTYDVSGILPLNKLGRLGNIKWLKRELIDINRFEMK